MSNQFVQRLVNYVANELIIKGLANSKTFQRMAVQSDHQMRQFQKAGQEHLERTVDQLNKQQSMGGKSTGGPPLPPLTGFPGFISAFFKEIRKDMGFGK